MANTIMINILGDAKGLNKALGGVQNDLGRLGTASTKAGNFLKNSLKVAGAGALVAGAAIGKFAKDSITSASDLNETISKTETIFGKASPAILKWGENAAKSLGMSNNEALTGVSTFGNFFDQIGIGSAESAKMSKAFVKMSADLGSFHNAAPVDVMDALAGATRGEYDALQKYIPTINAAAVQQKAMAMTGKDSADALTEAEKASALYALALKGQGAAQGDFARTSGSLANQQKILASQFENVKAKVGTALLPVMQQLMGFLIAEGLPAFEKLTNWLTVNLPPAIEQVVSKFKQFLPVIKSVATFIAENAGTILKLVAAFYAVVAVVALVNKAYAAYKTIVTVVKAVTTAFKSAQMALNIVMMANPIGLVIAAIVALVAVFVIAYKKSETFRKVVDKAWAGIKNATVAVWNFIKNLTSKTWDAIKNVATKAVDGVKNGVTKAWNAVKNVTSSVWNAVRNATTNAWNAVKNAISNVWNAITSKVKGATSGVKNAVSNAWTAAKNATTNMWNGIKTAISNAIENFMGKIRGIKGKILGAFSGAAGWLVSVGRNIVQGLINGIKNMASSAISAAKGVVSGAIAGAKSLLGINSPSKVFRQFGKWTVEGLAIGLDETSGKAAQASSNLARAVANGFEAPKMTLSAKAGLAAGAGTGYGSNVSIEVNVPPTADKASIGREIQKTLDEYYRTGGIRRA